MNCKLKNTGFSLTEVLMSVGILAVGMIFIAGVFPVSIYFTTTAAERTEAAVIADEAFAKIRLYGVDPAWLSTALPTSSVDFNDVSGIAPLSINLDEFAYPSTNTNPNPAQKQYYWSALCRRVDPNTSLVQVTVFISRKMGAGAEYWGRQGSSGWPNLESRSFPRPVPVNVIPASANQLQIIDAVPAPGDSIDEKTFINDGYTIVDNATGQIYRVLERDADYPDTIVLDRPWEGALAGGWVWVVPPPINGGRYPCIGVFQKVIKF